ncbi:hypothetical protein GW590_19310 [Rahnella sp. SAP-1]|uniref:DUF4365 domain-containing protein n=1 Tax=Rouxiella aceris TaxID=2703884 RepID=A0A848MPK4_9GAMM|nr:hypothetical protein [Rouxiella aceris]NMP29009.1 hypothetical protein [Rouxiella aceris]
MRDIGTMGENLFSMLCASAGLAANRSEIDRNGWDFFVEFPLEMHNSANPDSLMSPIECKVQVKSTDGNSKNKQIPISNLMRLIKTPGASFLFFVEYNGFNDAQNLYLVHLDEDLISKILKRTRELSIINTNNAFNKNKITIPYDHKNIIEPKSGSALKKLIEKYLPNGQEEYVKKKQKFINSVGYENGGFRMEFIASSNEQIQSLINSSLGINSPTKVSNALTKRVRFGMENPAPELSSHSAIINFENVAPYSEGSIIIREVKYSSPMRFKCKLFNSPLNSFIKKENIKVRILGDFFDFLISLYTGEVTCKFEIKNTMQNIYDLYRSIKLIELFTSKSTDITMRFDFPNFPKTEFEVTCGGGSFIYENEMHMIDHVINIANYFNIDKELSISLHDIQLHQSEINSFLKIIEADESNLRVNFRTVQCEISPEKEICCLFNASVMLGDFIVLIVFVVTGMAEKMADGRYNLKTSEKTTERKIILTRDDKFFEIDLDVVKDEIANKYIKHGYLVVDLQGE